MGWVPSGKADPVTHEWCQQAGFVADRDDNPGDRPWWLLMDREREQVMLTIRIHDDGDTCEVHLGPYESADPWPWDIYHKQTVRDICLAIGCRLTV